MFNCKDPRRKSGVFCLYLDCATTDTSCATTDTSCATGGILFGNDSVLRQTKFDHTLPGEFR